MTPDQTAAVIAEDLGRAREFEAEDVAPLASDPVFVFRTPIIQRRGVFIERSVAGGLLVALEANAHEWRDLPSQRVRLIRELSSAIEAYDAYWSNAPCDAPHHLPNAGHGGKPPSQDRPRRSTKTSPMKASSQPGGSATASGSRGRSSLPACGGNPASSTRRPESFSPTKSSAAKSTASASTRGEPGSGSRNDQSPRMNGNG